VVSWIALRLAMMPAVAAAKQAAALPIEDAAQEERVLERVAAAAPHTPGAVALYRQLIAAAKAIQGRDAGSAALVALPDLRAAIARIDRQLLRELARTPPTAATVWRAMLQPALAALPLSAAEIERLARALAATSSADGDQRKGGGPNDPTIVLE
jgi:cyclohexadienyl dehydratase